LLPGDSEPEVITTSISVTDPAVQLHRSASGIQVPGLNVWLIIALLMLVWSILFSVGLRVFAIARAGGAGEPVLERALGMARAERQPSARGSEISSAR
jgi:hypothetical protein